MQAVSTPFLPFLGRIPEDRRSQIDAEVLAAIGKYADGDCVNFGAVVVFASGTRS
jgi:hypothetical protein